MKSFSRKHVAIAVAALAFLALSSRAAQNKPPVANNDSFSVNANTVLNVPSPGVLTNDTDQDGDPLTAVLVAGVSHGTLQLAGDGSFNYTPTSNFSGTDAFTYAANDGQALSAIATVTIAVNAPANHQPIVITGTGVFFTDTGPVNLFENVAVNTSDAVFAVAQDVDNDFLTFITIANPSHGTLVTQPGENDPSQATIHYIYTPVSNFVGEDSFAFVANDGKTNSNPTTVHLHVAPVASINNVSVTEGNSALLPHAALFTVSFSLASTQILSVNWATQDGSAKSTSDYTAGSGTLTFPPGITNQTVRIALTADKLFEADETFTVQLSPTPTNSAVVGGARIGTCTILNDDLFVGVTEGIPPEALVKLGERFTYGIKWTHPERWRLLNTVDIRITDDEGDALYVRFDEPSNTFSLLNLANGTFFQPRAPGSRAHFETSAAVMYLENSEVIGSGPTGPSVTLNLALSFKPRAAGRVFRVDAFATDDFGNQQGFDEAGAIGVLAR
jgi:hypothetical protein